MDSHEVDPSGGEQAAVDSQRTAVSRKRLVGELLVKEGLITRTQLLDALRIQRESQSYQPLGQILVDHGLITQKQLDVVLDRYHKKYRLGDVLIETKVITEAQLHAALEHQRKTDLRLGEVLLHLNLVTEKQMREALCMQLDVPFVDLDACDLDSGLEKLINESYARHHRVIPILATNNSITVVMDDPSDLEVIEELRALTGLRIDAVTSTRAAFDRAFARVYGPGREPGLEWRYQELQSSYTRLYREHEEVTRVLAQVQSLPQTRPPDVERTEQVAAESPAVPRDEKTVTRTPTRVDNLSGVIDAVRQMVTDWGGVVDTVEALAREVEERRVEYGRLEQAHEALLATHEQLRQEFEASVQMMAGLEAAHEKLLRERGGSAQSLQEMRERYETLLRDRQLGIDELEVILRRFRVRLDQDAPGGGAEPAAEGHEP